VNSALENGEKPLDFETLKEMRFLNACLCESMRTMRLYPPVAWDSKHALADDSLPDGTSIGKGDRITFFPYEMGRMDQSALGKGLAMESSREE
jgi:cytochrome P450